MTEEQKVLEELRATIVAMPKGDRTIVEGYADAIRHIAQDGRGMLAVALVGAEIAAS